MGSEKIFTLPKKWCIRINIDNANLVGTYFSVVSDCYLRDWHNHYLHSLNMDLKPIKPGSGLSFAGGSRRDAFTEITTEQFKMYVMPESKDVTGFTFGDYIIVLMDIRSTSFPKNFCFRQVDNRNELLVEKDAEGDENGTPKIYYNSSSWRYATEEEAERYERNGGPYDTTTVSLKADMEDILIEAKLRFPIGCQFYPVQADGKISKDLETQRKECYIYREESNQKLWIIGSCNIRTPDGVWAIPKDTLSKLKVGDLVIVTKQTHSGNLAQVGHIGKLVSFESGGFRVFHEDASSLGSFCHGVELASAEKPFKSRVKFKVGDITSFTCNPTMYSELGDKDLGCLNYKGTTVMIESISVKHPDLVKLKGFSNWYMEDQLKPIKLLSNEILSSDTFGECLEKLKNRTPTVRELQQYLDFEVPNKYYLKIYGNGPEEKARNLLRMWENNITIVDMIKAPFIDPCDFKIPIMDVLEDEPLVMCIPKPVKSITNKLIL